MMISYFKEVNGMNDFRQKKLREAIWDAGTTQKAIAEKAGLTPPLLSQAINGRYLLDPSQKARIARVLGRKVEEIFTQ
jgi:transcriptional regulator with XRE-family HTH domain